jgi:thiamine biosynthesis lipoprotein
MRETRLVNEKDYWKGSFMAMASPCDVLMEVEVETLAREILDAVATETWRIEDKFSRYEKNNIIHEINNANGKTVGIDDETSRLFGFANELYEISDGLFDITSGVLRQVWTFDGSDRLPGKGEVNKVLKKIGWQRVVRQQGSITLPKEMEIDLGGIGKEYAVDRCVLIVRHKTLQSVLINFGGDLAVTAPRSDNKFWSVGRMVTGSDSALGMFQLYSGAIATSGDANRYLLKDGVRYSHILNPKTGWPVADAPHTISVAADTCLEAGMMSTLAMLHGADAETFLKMQEVAYWID